VAARGPTTPEEVAISVLAEVIAERSGRGGSPLRDGSAPIHAHAPGHEPAWPRGIQKIPAPGGRW
jgi:xanthine dehydrogenase accessory factor